MTNGDDLFHQAGRLLSGRSHWHFEPSTSPGAEPSWCLDPGGTIVLSVGVIRGRICVYVPAEDREIYLDDLDSLSQWVDAHEADFT